MCFYAPDSLDKNTGRLSTKNRRPNNPDVKALTRLTINSVLFLNTLTVLTAPLRGGTVELDSSSDASGLNFSTRAGDDGDHQRGIAADYSTEGLVEIVEDNVTKLMWQDNEDAATILGNHDIGSTSAVRNYCKLLDLGGYNDWRVPTIEELISSFIMAPIISL